MKMKFESKNQEVASLTQFGKRQFRYFLYSLGLVIFSLLLGTFGYDHFTELDIVDGFYNASMILSGMGEVVHMTTTQSKIFSSFYAFYSSIALSGIVVIFFAPIAHRFLHFLHLDDNEFTLLK
jgi:hypothetical protein